MLTGSSGVAEDGGIELATSPALMWVGAPKSGDALWSTDATAREQREIGTYRYAPPVIPVYGSYARFVWKPGVEKVGRLLPQAPFGPPEKCYGHAASEDPDLVRLAGRGMVVQIPWTIGRTYREFGTTEVRDRFFDAVRPLTGQRLFAELPEQVELILGRDGEHLVVHLINQSGARRKSFGPHLAVTGGRLRLKGGTSVPGTGPARVGRGRDDPGGGWRCPDRASAARTLRSDQNPGRGMNPAARASRPAATAVPARSTGS